MSLRDTIRAVWRGCQESLESFGWYGKTKPCSCPPPERHWGSTHPPDAVQVNKEYRPVVTETDAAEITEYKPKYVWRCERCGDLFIEHADRTVERDVNWHEPTSEVDTE